MKQHGWKPVKDYLLSGFLERGFEKTIVIHHKGSVVHCGKNIFTELEIRFGERYHVFYPESFYTVYETELFFFFFVLKQLLGVWN